MGDPGRHGSFFKHLKKRISMRGLRHLMPAIQSVFPGAGVISSFIGDPGPKTVAKQQAKRHMSHPKQKHVAGHPAARKPSHAHARTEHGSFAAAHPGLTGLGKAAIGGIPLIGGLGQEALGQLAGMGGGAGAVPGMFPGHRHRSMKVTNPKALRRAMRRVEGFAKLARKTISFTHHVRIKHRRKK